MSDAGLALVIGAGGGIGAALVARLQSAGNFAQVLGVSRSSTPALDLCDEASMAEVARHTAALGLPLRPSTRLMLHAWQLTLVHPNTHAPLELEAPLPPGFRGSCACWWSTMTSCTPAPWARC